MNGLNLSEWALDRKSLVWYFMLLALAAGILAYRGLGREEDPPFTIKTMVIQANWPGASTGDMIQQVTDRIEKKLEELDFARLRQKLHHSRPNYDLREPPAQH